MKKFLFVCMGNVGRSQMAEAFYNYYTNSTDSWSAGIQSDTPEKYDRPAQKIIDLMSDVDIDVSKARVKTISQEMIENSERIIIICKRDECPDFLLKSKKITFWADIEDPFEMSIEETKKIRDQIKNRILALI
jgi:arsenate reductase (thioredoxin)